VQFAYLVFTSRPFVYAVAFDVTDEYSNVQKK